MKRTITILALALLPVLQLKAQVKIGDNPTTINAGSVLEMESTDKGVLFPRVNLTDLTKWQPLTGTAIAGMTVYNTNTTTGVGFYYWDGVKWVKQLTSNNDAWLTTGNAGTTPAANFLGTTDNQPLNFRINGKQSMILNTKNLLLISDTNAIASNFIYPAGIGQYTGGKLAVQSNYQYPSGFYQKGVTEIEGGFIKLNMRQNARPSSQGGSAIEFIGGDENITTEKMKMCATVLKRYVKDANSGILGNSFIIANRDLYPNTDYGMFNSSIGLMEDKSIRFFTTSGNLLDLSRTKMSILENGNVGIGTTTPYALLTLYNNTPRKQLFTAVCDNSEGGVMDDFILYSYGSAPQLTFTMNASRGTMAAPLPLVDGDLIYNMQGVALGTAICSTYEVRYKGDGTNNKLSETRIDNSAARAMTINKNNNIGIGTTSPTERLEVAGKIKSTSAIFTDLPVYGSDTDADADVNLLSGSLYKLSGTGRQVFVKP